MHVALMNCTLGSALTFKVQAWTSKQQEQQKIAKRHSTNWWSLNDVQT